MANLWQQIPSMTHPTWSTADRGPRRTVTSQQLPKMNALHHLTMHPLPRLPEALIPCSDLDRRPALQRHRFAH